MENKYEKDKVYIKLETTTPSFNSGEDNFIIKKVDKKYLQKSIRELMDYMTILDRDEDNPTYNSYDKAAVKNIKELLDAPTGKSFLQFEIVDGESILTTVGLDNLVSEYSNHIRKKKEECYGEEINYNYLEMLISIIHVD